MFFCEQCGGILIKTSEGIGYCSCGHKQSLGKGFSEKNVRTPSPEILEREIDPIAAFDHVCSKCGFDKARLYSKGTMVTDEDEHMAFVCGRCGHHDRCDGLKLT